MNYWQVIDKLDEEKRLLQFRLKSAEKIICDMCRTINKLCDQIEKLETTKNPN